MNESRTIDAKRFDALMEKLLTEDGTFVIDNGANTFSPLLAYMVENNVISFLTETEKVYLHTVVGGGDTLADTANGFNSIAQGIEDAPVVLWLNEHFGPMKPTKARTSPTRRFSRPIRPVCMASSRCKHAIIRPTVIGDIKKMNTKRLTVEEIMQSPDFALMEKQRIRNVAKDVFGQLEKIEF